MTADQVTDQEKVAALNELGVTVHITGDVLTLRFQNGGSEDWLAVSPMMLARDAWQAYETLEFGGRLWIKCEGIV